MTRQWDAVIVGGGPVGAFAALMLAAERGRVLLLEGHPGSARRFAGEWLHPVGRAALARIGDDLWQSVEAHEGRGFWVHPDDGGEPIELRYPDAQTALSFHHERLVEALRRRAVAHPRVTWIPGARAVAIDGHRVSYRSRDGEAHASADLIVGADGRSSMVRAHLGLPSSELVSKMAAVEVRDVSLPMEGFGHVALGGPGPILIYRVDATRVRLAIDVPLELGSGDRATLWSAYSDAVPRSLREGFRQALRRDGGVQWASAHFQPRSSLGRDHLALVGDAAGHYHPLTATGLSQGFLDVLALSESRDVADYHRRREPRGYVGELLSTALYQVFGRPDASATAIRDAVFGAWRQRPSEREATMHLLGGAMPTRRQFAATFARIGARALPGRLGRPAELWPLREWMAWPLSAMAPPVVRRRLRARSTNAGPWPLEAPASASSRGRAPEENELVRAQSLLIDGLHGELHQLAPQFGRVSALALARQAMPMLHAIGRVRTDAAMESRMRLGRRRLATQGASVLLDRSEGPCIIDLAELLLCLYDVRGADDSLDGRDAVLGWLASRQDPEGGFGDVETTALVVRALVAVGQRASEPSVDLASIIEGAVASLFARLDPATGQVRAHRSVRVTACAVVAMLAAGVDRKSPRLRAAVAGLLESQRPDGAWCDRGELGPPSRSTTAMCGWALAASGVLGQPGYRAARYLIQEASAPIDALDRHSRCEELIAIDAILACMGAIEEAPPVDVHADRSFCRAVLPKVSRTFSRPIELLPDPLRDHVGCAYLLCRLVDTIEDAPDLDDSVRDGLFRQFHACLDGSGDAEALGRAMEEVPGSPSDIELGRQAARVFRVFGEFGPEVRSACRRWIGEMADGMRAYRHREDESLSILSSVADLEHYCYYVAGTVGHLLTELFVPAMAQTCSPERAAELRARAESFGLGLQLVNILKDVTDDRQRGWSYVPRQVCEDVGLDPERLLDPSMRKQAHLALAPIFELARDRLDDALEYTLRIPAEHTGIRLFCLLPLWMAVRTLVLAEGNDDLFEPGRPVKISRAEVESLIGECVAAAADDRRLRRQYQKLWAPGVPLHGNRLRRGTATGEVA